MSNISASIVKELREKTGCGMMDCKKALLENDGDLEKSIDWLKQKGLSSAAKRADRSTGEGIVSIERKGDNVASLVEVNSETDFVARNENLQKFSKDIGKISAVNSCSSVDTLLEKEYENGKSVKDELVRLVSVVGENLRISKVATLEVNPGIVASYVHNAIASDIGKIGVIVALSSDSDKKDSLMDLGKKIAMHIAAIKPKSLSIESLSKEEVDREKAILKAQAEESGRPANVIEKMIEGRIGKFYEEVVLLEQPFVMDPKKKIKEIVEEKAKELGSKIEVVAYHRMEVGVS